MKPILSVSMAVLVAATTMSSASAAIVSTTFTLTDLVVGDNRLNIEFMDIITVDDLILSGSFSADVGIDSGGIIDSFAFDSGTISIEDFDLNFNLDIFAANITGTSLQATPYSNATSSVNGAGDFDATNSGVALDAGTVSIVAPAASFFVDIDFATTPESFDLSVGTGNITSAPTPVLGEYEITLNLPIIASVTTVNDGITIIFDGGVTAVGLVTVAIPEPTSGAFLASVLVGAGTVIRRRRK